MTMINRLTTAIGLVCAAIAIAVCFAQPAFVRAEERVYVYEYSRNGIILPIEPMLEGQSYQVQVFAKDDSAYVKPLPLTGGMTFLPETLGKFNVRYLINDNGVESYRYKTINIVDTTKPVFQLNVKESYRVGDVVKLKPAISDNTAHLATVKYEMLIDGKVDGEIPPDGMLTAERAGNYRVKVTVTDAGGNRAHQTVEFRVEGDDAAKTGNRGLVIGLSVCGGALSAAGAVLAVILVKKKKQTVKGQGDSNGKD